MRIVEVPMPLPPPASDLTLPAACKLNALATAAILDDAHVHHEVRVAVVQRLEADVDPAAAFAEFCRDECFGGPAAPDPADLVTGRALLATAFERGVAGGWFGANGMMPAQARELANDLRATFSASGAKAAGAFVASALPPVGPPAPLSERVSWHYFDDAARDRPFASVAPDLASRLALPSAPDPGHSLEYVVLEIPARLLPGPCAPRFTDCQTLDYLDYWRPGGQTAPRGAGLAPLSELVDRPMALGHVVTGVTFVTCDG